VSPGSAAASPGFHAGAAQLRGGIVPLFAGILRGMLDLVEFASLPPHVFYRFFRLASNRVRKLIWFIGGHKNPLIVRLPPPQIVSPSLPILA
jgi:hypothetical protein